MVRAVGGWLTDIEGVFERYEGSSSSLHGRHQVDHLATAVAAVEVFLGSVLDPTLVMARGGGVGHLPGRIEVVGRNPLVVIDGAHNLQSLTGLATALLDEFPPARRILVVGFGGKRDPGTLLEPLLGAVNDVVATSAADGSALPAEEVAVAATARFGRTSRCR